MHTQPVLNPNALLITVKSNWLLILYYYTVLYSIYWMPVCLWGPTVYVIVLSLCLRLCFAKTAAVTAAAMVVFPIQQNSKMSNVQTLWWFWRKKIIATFSCTNELMSIIHTILILTCSSLVAIIIFILFYISSEIMCNVLVHRKWEKNIAKMLAQTHWVSIQWVYLLFPPNIVYDLWDSFLSMSRKAKTKSDKINIHLHALWYWFSLSFAPNQIVNKVKWQTLTKREPKKNHTQKNNK